MEPLSIPSENGPHATTAATSENAIALELYLHVPFCHSRCSYCDFFSQATAPNDPILAAYAKGIMALVEALGNQGILKGPGTVYIGGGTPTVLGSWLPKLVGATTHLDGFYPQEVSVEANPESTNLELLSALKAQGATRVSVGVQALQDDLLQGLGRIHSASQALATLEHVRAVGLRASADLLAGIAQQWPGMLARAINGVVEAGATSVSVYDLEVYPSTPLGRLVANGQVALPTEDETADLLEEANDALEARGFCHYEISNWALPGSACLHNWGYWHGTPYLGLGPSAASMLPRTLYEKLRQALPQLPSAPSSIERLRFVCTSRTASIAAQPDLERLSFSVEGLTASQALAEDLMLAVRCNTGLSSELVLSAQERFGDRFENTIERLCGWELLEPIASGGWKPTERGWLMGNVLSGELWELAGSFELWNPPISVKP